MLDRAAAGLPEAEYRKARPAAFFGSIHGTLNHLLLTDRVWFGRIEGAVPEGITGLDQILYDDLESLRAAREAEDRRIVDLIGRLSAAELARDLHYTDSAGNPRTLKTAVALATVFNHQTHHRGQVHALIKDAGAAPPSLDLPVYLSQAK
jgi:uncharacterized damage-inducible protein DinB